MKPYTGEQALSRPLITANQATIDNMRLWDWHPLLQTFGQQQILRQYYEFRDVDIDRYKISWLWGLMTARATSRSIASMRAMYEPYVHALAVFLMMPLPAWVPPEDARDNWQGTV